MQTSLDHLRVRLQLRPGAEPGAAARAVEDNLRRLYADHGAVAPTIAVEFGPPELHPVSRKLRRIIRSCDPPAETAGFLVTAQQSGGR